MAPTDSKPTGKPKKRRRGPRSRPLETRAAKNRPEALRLKIAGHSYREIAATLGVSHVTALQYVQDELASIAASPEEREHLRELERARLETVLARMMALATRADIIIETQKEGTRGPITITVEDYAAATKAADTVVKISARLAALYGLDGPQKIEHSGGMAFAVTTQLADEIAAARAARPPAPPEPPPVDVAPLE